MDVWALFKEQHVLALSRSSTQSRRALSDHDVV